MPETIRVRAATEDDLPALAATLASAFADYPWTRWVVDHRDHERRLRELYLVYLGVALRFGRVSMTEDASAVAAWTWSESRAAQAAYLHETGLGGRIAELAGDRAEAGAVADELLEPHALTEPHWYLAAVGVAPDRQGAGLGTRVLTPMLETCDAEGRLAALETSAPDNLRLYERLGFEVRAELDAPGGPHVWLMHRRPRR